MIKLYTHSTIRFALVFILFFCIKGTAFVYGQSLLYSDDFLEQNGNGSISLNLSGGYDSDGINGNLFRSFLKGGFIHRDIRNSSLVPTAEIQKLGMEYVNELQINFPWLNLLKNDSLNVILSIGQEQSVGVDYDQVFYNLVFFGNESYLGEFPTFKKVRFENWQTRSIGFGLLNRHNGNRILLKLHQGMARQKFNFDNGNFHISNDGHMIQAGLSSNLFSTSFSNDSTSNTSGFGIGLDGQIQIFNRKKAGNLLLSYRNMGVMFWPKNNNTIELNSTYFFEGVDLSEVFEPTFTTTEIGDFENYFDVEKTSTNNIEPLPMKFQLDYFKALNSKVVFNARAFTSLINLWRPQFEILGFHQIKSKVKLGVGVKYGGFGGLNYNFYSAFNIMEKWHLNLDISYLSGWLSKAGYGSFARIGLARTLNFNKVES